MAKKKNIPDIRFKGFTEEWEDKILGELLDITSASRVHKNEWTKSGVPFFRSSDVVSEYKGQKNNKAFISIELYKELSNKSGCVKKNDVLVTGGGSIGIPYLVKTNEPLYFKDADLLWLKSSNNINGYFLYTFFSTLSFRRYVNSITHIGTISHYTIEQAKSTPIRIPKNEEQVKIANFLDNINQLITQHQQKYDKLLTIKKAMLKKMFPQNGANVPEIRFKGFSEVWAQLKYNEIAHVKRGLTYKPSDVVDNGVKVLRSSNIFENTFIQKEDDVFVKEEAINIEFVKENDILITSANGSSHLVGKHTVIQGLKNKAVHGGFMLLSTAKNPFFLNASMSSSWYNKFINVYVAGGNGAIGNLKISDLENQDIFVPNEDEQTKIGNFFKDLDNIITLNKQKLEKLKTIKKAFLDKMFV